MQAAGQPLHPPLQCDGVVVGVQAHGELLPVKNRTNRYPIKASAPKIIKMVKNKSMLSSYRPAKDPIWYTSNVNK